MLLAHLCVHQGDAYPVIVEKHAAFGAVEVQFLDRERQVVISRLHSWSSNSTAILTSMSNLSATSSRILPSRLAWAARLVNHTQGIQYLLKSEW